MYTNRRAILSLIALGRITPGEAERLIAACSPDNELWWLLAGSAICAGLWQVEPHVFAGMAHLLRPVIEGLIPAIHHVIADIAMLFGGNR